MFTADMDMDRGRMNYRRRVNGDDRSRIGYSIAYDAIDKQDQGGLQSILEKEPDILKCIDENGLTPLSYAASKGYVDMVVFLLKTFPESKKYPNNDNSYPIHTACLGGHVNVLTEFYNNSRKSIFTPHAHGRTVLHLAAKECGNKLKEVVIYLLSLPEGNQLRNIKDENGKVPLDLAKSSGNVEVVQVFNSATAI